MTTTKPVKMNKTDVIETKSGKIQGYIDNGIHVFKGIPYTEPPIGDLRFKPPADKRPWNGVLDATEYGPYAFQWGDFLQLFLDVHPKKVKIV